MNGCHVREIRSLLAQYVRAKLKVRLLKDTNFFFGNLKAGDILFGIASYFKSSPTKNYTIHSVAFCKIIFGQSIDGQEVEMCLNDFNGDGYFDDRSDIPYRFTKAPEKDFTKSKHQYQYEVVSFDKEQKTSTTCVTQDDKTWTPDNKPRDIIKVAKNFDGKVTAKSKTSFRKTRWGMSRDQVKHAETAKLLKESGDRFFYDVRVGGLEAFLIYEFIKDKLVAAKYTFYEKHSNRNNYLTDYSSIKKILKNKYGEPIKENTYWDNDLYKDDYQSFGTAVAVGHLSKFSEWKAPDTQIMLSIYGDNFEITHSVEYLSVSLHRLLDMRDDQKYENQF